MNSNATVLLVLMFLVYVLKTLYQVVDTLHMELIELIPHAFKLFKYCVLTHFAPQLLTILVF